MNENNNTMEKLFFIVWRNIILKNHIFKFLNGYVCDDKLFKFQSFKYQEIVSASWLIKNKYFELLKLKVKLGDYLAFNYNISESSEWYPAKRYDKERGYISLNKLSFYNKEISNDNNLDQLFYKNLFNNYSKYFIENGNYENTIFDCLEYDNGKALESLFEIISTGSNSSSSSSSPTTTTIDYNSLFLKSIEIGSFECGVVIFKSLPKLNESRLKKIWNLVLNDKDDNGDTIVNFGIMINKRSNFLLGECFCVLPLPTQSILTTYSKSVDLLMYEFPIYQQQLSTLLESVTTIIKFKELFQPLINSIKAKSFKFSKKQEEQPKYITICKLLNSYNLKLPDIKEIEIMNSLYTNDQLNTLVQDFIKDDPNVMKLYSTLLPFTKPNYFIENYTFYKIKYENDYTNYQLSEYNNVTSFHPILFGYYDLEDLKLNGIPLYFGQKYPFYYCAKDNKLKYQYINNLLNDIVNEQKQVNFNQTQPPSLWYIKVLNTFLIELVKKNNIELVKFILEFKELEIKFEIKPYSIGLLYSGISSVEMFDLIIGNEKFNNQESILSNPKENQFQLLKSFILSNKPTLLQHYKSTFKQDYFIGIERLNLIEYNDNHSNISIEIYKFIYENLSDFRNCGPKLNCDRYNFINFWHTPTPHYLRSTSLEDFKYIVQRTPIDIKYNPLSNVFDYSFVNYVYTTYPEDIKSGRFICHGINKLMLKYFKYRISPFDQDTTSSVIGKKELKIIHLLKSNQIENLDQIIEIDIGLHANIGFVDILFKNYTGRDQPEYIFLKIFKVACKYGQFSVYKHLESKYSHHFKRITHVSHEESHQVGNTFLFREPIINGSIEIFQSMIDKFYDGVVPKIGILKNFGINSSYNSRPLATYFKLFK